MFDPRKAVDKEAFVADKLSCAATGIVEIPGAISRIDQPHNSRAAAGAVAAIGIADEKGCARGCILILGRDAGLEAIHGRVCPGTEGVPVVSVHQSLWGP